MILTLTHKDREQFPQIFDQMFRARALIFSERLGWSVQVNDGLETDLYDHEEEPVYLVALDNNDNFLGSLRLLATTGPTMLQSEFSTFFDEPVDVSGPTIWECTKFCVLPASMNSTGHDDGTTSSELLIALCDLCLSSGIEFILGVFDNSMSRIYKRIGWHPEILARSRPEIGNISVGLWEASPEALTLMKQRLAERKAARQPLAA